MEKLFKDGEESNLPSFNDSTLIEKKLEQDQEENISTFNLDSLSESKADSSINQPTQESKPNKGNQAPFTLLDESEEKGNEKFISIISFIK